MAFENNQVEPTLPAGNKNYKRQSVNHLPKYFRTPYNKKFLVSAKAFSTKAEALSEQDSIQKIAPGAWIFKADK